VEDFSGTSLYDQSWSSKHTFFPVADLEDCTTYYWRVAAIKDMTFGPFSESRAFFTNKSGLCAQSMAPQLEAMRDLACYQGPVPGTYPILGYMVQGETAPIVAQSLDQTWWYIENPDAPDICAVPKDGGSPEGDTSDVPMWNNPEIPTDDQGDGDGGLVCTSNLGQADCLAAGGNPKCVPATNPPQCTCDCP
jgi:hypothetical protein